MEASPWKSFAEIYAVQELEHSTLASLLQPDALGKDFQALFLPKPPKNNGEPRDGVGMFIDKSWNVIDVCPLAQSEPNFHDLGLWDSPQTEQSAWPQRALIVTIQHTVTNFILVVAVGHLGAHRHDVAGEFLRHDSWCNYTRRLQRLPISTQLHTFCAWTRTLQRTPRQPSMRRARVCWGFLRMPLII